MGKHTEISWTDHTYNPWHGCTKVSAGCDNCYAETLSNRWGRHIWGPDADRLFFADKHWAEPLRWDADAEKAGIRRRVFCGSMCDWAEGRPDQADARERLFALIEATPMLDWQLLTKRPGAIRHLVPPHWLITPPANVWYGTSVENQEQAERRIPQLLNVPAAVRFLSCEPLLGPVDIGRWLCCPWCSHGDQAIQDDAGTWYHRDGHWVAPCPTTSRGYAFHSIDWIITGGESGPGARPCHPDWVRGLRDQCEAAGVAHFFKQWGEYEPYEPDAQPPFWNDQHGRMYDGHGLDVLDPETGDVGKGWHELSLVAGVAFRRVGKKAAGRLLDGRTWDEFPAVEVLP